MSEVVGEQTVDARRRLNLSKAGVSASARFLITRDSDGTLHLIPVTSVPTRDLPRAKGVPE